MTNKSIIRIPMQFFAEGEGAGNAGQQQNSSQQGAPAAGQEGQNGSELSLEQVFGKFTADQLLDSEQMKKALQSRTDKQVTKALETARLKWQQEQLDALDESKKLAKMTEAERQKYQFEKDKKAFEEQKAAFEHAQLEVSVGAELQKRGLDASFSKYLTAKDAETSKANIEAFEKLFNEAVTAAVGSRLKGGTPPKDNAGGKEVSGVEAAFLARNPDLKI